MATSDDEAAMGERARSRRPRKAKAREAGSEALAMVRRGLTTRLAEAIRSDPDRAASAVEVGLIDRRWLEDPHAHPVSTAAPRDVLQRFLARSVEQKPSLVNQLGLSTLQLLSYEVERTGDGHPESVTVMFTDLEGFTRYTAEHGDAAAIDVLTDHQRRIGPVVRSRGGKVVKRLGDGLLLGFPEPAAAALAGVELVDAVHDPLRLRAGMHVGEVVVRPDDIVGHVVNVAARVTEAARGGEVLVTGDVRDAAGEVPGLRFGRPRKAKLKGIAGKVEVCAATMAPPDGSATTSGGR